MSQANEDPEGRKWTAQRRAALRRDGYACQKCGRRSALQVHHIKPRRAGVDHSLDNLLTVCTSCHLEWDAVEAGTNMTHDQWLTTPHYNALVAAYRTLPPELRQAVDLTWRAFKDLRAQEPITDENTAEAARLRRRKNNRIGLSE